VLAGTVTGTKDKEYNLIWYVEVVPPSAVSSGVTAAAMSGGTMTNPASGAAYLLNL